MIYFFGGEDITGGQTLLELWPIKLDEWLDQNYEQNNLNLEEYDEIYINQFREGITVKCIERFSGGEGFHPRNYCSKSRRNNTYHSD
jgi:hypothetical protein